MRSALRVLVSATTTVALVLAAGPAWADQVQADGDTAVSGLNVSVTDCAVPHSYTGALNIKFNGSSHYANGAVVGVTSTRDAAGVTAGLTVSGGSVTLPNPWNSSSADRTAPIGVTVPAGIANGTYKVTVTASGSKSGGGTLVLDDAYNVIVNCATNAQPVLNLPGTITAEATSAAGAAVTYVATATDAEDNPDPAPTCSPASGSTFPITTTVVSCSVTDANGATAAGTFNVVVADTTGPTVTVPSVVNAEATSASGAVVTFASSASDVVDGARATTCTRNSGSTFALGTTSVTCNASDTRGNPGSASFNVVVSDTTAPSLNLPSGVQAEATSAAGAAVTYVATASDSVDGPLTPSCLPQSGSTFELGTTTVECTVRDAHDNPASGSFDVEVVDTTAPTLDLPANQIIEATGPSGAAATWEAPTATDAVSGSVLVTCDYDSGDVFPVDQTTTVSCSASDEADNPASGSFTIQVTDHTAPALDLPDDIETEATGPSGAAVTYDATADDLVDGSRPVDCAPVSGATFGITTTAVNCSASDTRSNTAYGSFDVTVVDTTPPALSLPTVPTTEATGSSGAVVTFSVSALDIVDLGVTPDCSADSGDTFPIGTTTVHCTATDAHSNQSSGQFDVTVADTTAPTLNLPSPAPVEATGPLGAAVTFSVSASDLVDGAVDPDCSADSGDVFPVGTTSVHCTATDAHSNQSSGDFDVTVVDTTAPTLNLPSAVLATATSALGANVPYTATATDLVDGTVPISCSPISGAAFAIGTTTVHCTATDERHNGASGQFTVTVGYRWDGYLQPINDTAHTKTYESKFKLGSTVPVKFQLKTATGTPVSQTGAPTFQRGSNRGTCDANTNVETVAADTPAAGGADFRWDAAAQQYVYNFSTKGLTPGEYRIYANLADGSHQAVDICLAK